MQRLRADIISHDSVPSTPSVLLEIFRLIDDDGDIHRLFGAIERDTGLTARILRTANGSFFGQSRTVATVERAVLVLGVALVRSLAVSAAVFEAVGDRLPAPRSISSGITRWRPQSQPARSRTGRGSATETRRSPPDCCTTPDICCWRAAFGTSTARCRRAATSSSRSRSAPGLGVDHATAGGWLFDAWQLPPAIVAAVAQHHAIEPAAGLPTLVAAANLVTRYPDGSVLAADAADPHGVAARAVAAACNLTAESWVEVAAGPRGGVRA